MHKTGVSAQITVNAKFGFLGQMFVFKHTSEFPFEEKKTV